MYNMFMYCEWEATYLSPIDKIPDNPTCPHKRRKARYLLEKSYKTINFLIYSISGECKVKQLKMPFSLCVVTNFAVSNVN